MGYPMMRAGRGRDRDRVRKRIFALEAMGKLAGENESFAELLIENISEPDTPVRWTVIWALANLEGQEEQVVPLMIDSIGDTSRFVQATVLIGLGKVAHRPEISVPLLIDYLHDSDPYLQSAAALSLASFPVYGRSAVDSLQELIGVEPNSIKNGDRQSHSYWEIRRFPPHLEELQMISVRGAAEIALSAIEDRTAQAGFQVEADDE